MIQPGLHVITGPMYASKSTELLAQIERIELARRKVWVWKPKMETRYGLSVVTHNGVERGCFLTGPDVDDMAAIAELARGSNDLDAFAFDEVQFMGPLFVGLVQELARSYRVICAGLDLDAFGQPWETTMHLMALAETVDKRKAVCVQCGLDASRSQRLLNNEPVTSGEVVQVGGTESYEPRCAGCFVAATINQEIHS